MKWLSCFMLIATLTLLSLFVSKSVRPFRVIVRGCSMLPALRLTGALGQYNRSLVALKDAATGAFNYVGNNTLNNSLSLSLNQNITLTDGMVSVTTGLGHWTSSHRKAV